MNTFLFKKAVVIGSVIACLPFFTSAKQSVVEVGDYATEYDQTFEADTNGNGKNDRTSYYMNGQLVFTAYDENEDGRQDLWFRFKNGDTADLELADADADGDPDMITEVDAEEKAEVIYNADAEGGIMFGLIFFIAMGALALAFWQRKFIARKIKEKMTHDKTVS